LPDGASDASFVGMMTRPVGGAAFAGAALLLALLPACQRPPEEKARSSDNTLRDDMKDVARSTQQAAKDLGRAAVGAADKAKDKVGEGGTDAWITTKVKSELGTHGFDPLSVHVDTAGKVVTLSGTVHSAAEREKAVALARSVKDVASVTDHLFVEPARK
jgi:hyperosmotically inducible protein